MFFSEKSDLSSAIPNEDESKKDAPTKQLNNFLPTTYPPTPLPYNRHDQLPSVRQSTPQKHWLRELQSGIVGARGFLKSKLAQFYSDNSVALKELDKRFLIRIPHKMITPILQGQEAIARQFMPNSEELLVAPQELSDPIGDETFSPVKGITHRYPDRVLIKPTHLCASYCRFCFRKYKVSKPAEKLSLANTRDALNYINSHNSIREVIFTGGDPLTLQDAEILYWIQEINAIKHVNHVRFHTRVPVLLSERISPDLLKILSSSTKRIWIVIHINSHHEITADALDAFHSMQKAGLHLLAQSVLLKGVNDSQNALKSLFVTLSDAGVLPYYLHYPDLAEGTSHFRIPLQHAVTLFDSLRGQISGYQLPQFVIDIPGGGGKVPVHSNWVWPDPNAHETESAWFMRSPLTGKVQRFVYPPSQI